MTGKITLHLVAAEKTHITAMTALKKTKTGVYVSTTRPASTILNETKKNKINTENILLIELGGTSQKENVVNVPNGALTELSLSINQALQLIEGKKTLIFEGIDALTLHANPEEVQKFCQFIIVKLRDWNVDAHIIVEKSTRKELITLLTQLCDTQKTS